MNRTTINIELEHIEGGTLAHVSLRGRQMEPVALAVKLVDALDSIIENIAENPLDMALCFAAVEMEMNEKAKKRCVATFGEILSKIDHESMEGK